MWFGEDQRANAVMTRVQKGLDNSYIHIFINYSALNNEHNWADLCVLFKERIDKPEAYVGHKLRKGGLDFPSNFERGLNIYLLMQCKFPTLSFSYPLLFPKCEKL